MSSVYSTKSVETINVLGSDKTLEKSLEKFETDTVKKTRISISSESIQSEKVELLALPSFQVPAAPAPELSTFNSFRVPIVPAPQLPAPQLPAPQIPYIHSETYPSKHVENPETSEQVPQENTPKDAFENLENQARNCIMTSATIGGTAILVGIALVSVLILGYMSAVTVEAGHVGVVKRFGAVQEPALNPGFNFITPFITSVYEYSRVF